MIKTSEAILLMVATAWITSVLWSAFTTHQFPTLLIFGPPTVLFGLIYAGGLVAALVESVVKRVAHR